MVQIYRFVTPVAGLRLDSQPIQIAHDPLSFYGQIDQQVIIRNVHLLVIDFRTVGQIAEEMSNMGIDIADLFPLEQRAQSQDISVIESSHKDGIQAIQMAGEVPETRLSVESTIH